MTFPCFPIPKEHLLVDGVGQEKIRERYASKTVYLSQFTLPCYGELTVKQYLTLVALMRVPRNMSDTVELVEQIICEVCVFAHLWPLDSKSNWNLNILVFMFYIGFREAI